MSDLASSIQNEFGSGIRSFVEGLGDMPDDLQRALAAFIADLDATINGTGKGIFDLRTRSATGVIPRQGSSIVGGLRSGSGKPGSVSNPLVVIPAGPSFSPVLPTGPIVDIAKPTAPLTQKDALQQMSAMAALDAGAGGPASNYNAKVVADLLKEDFGFADLGGMGANGGLLNSARNEITVNVMNADPEAVVEVLRKYNREQGLLPVNIGFY
mgnify:CR=1 FL=1